MLNKVRQQSIAYKKSHDELRKQNDQLWLKYHGESVQRKKLHN